MLSHNLEGIYERYKAEKEVQKRFKSKEQKDKEKREREQRLINFNKDYIVGVDPVVVNIITCFEGDVQRDFHKKIFIPIILYTSTV